VEKEHQSSSRKGRSRSATLQSVPNAGNQSSSKVNKNRTATTRPASLEESCSFRLSIFCSAFDSKWYISEQFSKARSSSCCQHTNHLPVDSTHILTHKSQLLNGKTKEQIYRLIESGRTNNTIVAAIKSEYGVTITNAQVEQFREDRVQAILKLTENEVLPRSAAERLMALFKNMSNVSYVYVKHNQNSGFVTYTGSRQDNTNLGQAINAEVKTWRQNLKLIDSEDILVSFAWCHDEEKRKMVMFPEYFGIDMTFGLNKEQRNLVTVAGVDGHNKSFIGLRCWMPSKQRVVYQWAVGVALPTLVSNKVTQRNRVVSSDGELSLVESIESTINAPDGPLRNSKFRQDYYQHLVKQPWQKLMAACHPVTAECKLLTTSIALWIKSFFRI